MVIPSTEKNKGKGPTVTSTPGGYPLVNVYKKGWKTTIFNRSILNQLFLNGHVQQQTVKVPEGNDSDNITIELGTGLKDCEWFNPGVYHPKDSV